MAGFDANDFERALDFFILSGFSDGPRSLPEIQQRVQWEERLLYVAAKRKGMQGLSPLPEALARLQSEGFLKGDRSGEQPSTETIYSLTDAGKYRLEQERARRRLMVSQFVEDEDLESSFRRFLDRGEGRWGLLLALPLFPR